MKQLSFENASEVFEKLVQDRNGRLFRVRFVVVERDGVLRGRVISCEEIRGLDADRTPTLRRHILPFLKGVRRRREGFYLPVRLSPRPVNGERLRVNSFCLSPYFNKFDFLTVIKIRAPSQGAELLAEV